MKRYLVILIALAAALAHGQSEGALLGWEEARGLALKNNSQYQAKLAEQEAAEWNRKAALGSFLPTLSLDGTWLYMEPATEVQAGAASIKLNNDLRTFGLSLSQPLFLGGKLTQAYQMAKISAELAQTAAEAQRLTLLGEVDRLYLGLLQTQELLDLSQLDQRAAALNLQIAQLKYDNGLISKADFLRFQSQHASKEVSLLQSQTALQLAQLNLRNYLGLDYLPSAAAIGDLESDPSWRLLDVYDTAATRALTDLALAESRSSSQSLRALEKSLELSRRGLHIAKGAFLPSLMLIGSLSYGENGLDRYKFDGSSQIMLTASLPLLPQLGNFANLKKAASNYRKARLEAETARDGVSLGSEAAILNLVSAAKQVRAARIALDFTLQSYDQLQERYRLDLISAKDLLDAELMLSAARLAHSNAVYNYHQARASLLQILGLEDGSKLDNLIILGADK